MSGLILSESMVIAPAPGAYLSVDQARRVTCLQVACTLSAGRAIQWPAVLATARWLYNGEEP